MKKLLVVLVLAASIVGYSSFETNHYAGIEDVGAGGKAITNPYTYGTYGIGDVGTGGK